MSSPSGDNRRQVCFKAVLKRCPARGVDDLKPHCPGFIFGFYDAELIGLDPF